ncbi:MAG: alpha/beta fold hydrolase [Ferruginibacter sp.]
MNVQKKLAFGYIRTKLNALSIINKRKAGEEAFRLFCTPLLKLVKPGQVFKDAEPLEFLLDGKKIRGFRSNHPAEHKVLLLHGFSSNCHNFDHYVTALVQKGYEVLAFDAPAHGASEGKTVNAVGYSEMIKKVIELYGPIEGFIAHSFGGLAICLALENIMHDQNTKLVLIAPATETTTAIDSAFNILGIKNQRLKTALENIILEKSGREPAWFSIRRAMHNIRSSVLWVHDEDDDVTPLHDALKVKDDNHPNIKFNITKGLGHRKIYRDAAVKKVIVDFL